MKIIISIISILVMSLGLFAQQNSIMNNSMDNLATMGGGCFWCTEAVFEEVEGVTKVVSGYAGGEIKNPSYREVTTGRTGHAEAIQITFDAGKISYQEILKIFFKVHDPTSLNKQGADVGTQYRSIILYHNEEQKRIAEDMIRSLDNSGEFNQKIVTQVEALKTFYIAEEVHQDYFKKNPDQAYCSYVIKPKLNKFRRDFSKQLRQE